MKRTLLILLALVAACATGPTPIDESRKRFDEGRNEEALAVLQKAMREYPEDNAVKAEYFRQRDVSIAQWLTQAESLRQGSRFDAADTLYRRVLAHDPANSRAQAGLTQIEADRRHWQRRLEALRTEIRTEPERIRRTYDVKATRVEPVGLVYLWPVSG